VSLEVGGTIPCRLNPVATLPVSAVIYDQMEDCYMICKLHTI